MPPMRTIRLVTMALLACALQAASHEGASHAASPEPRWQIVYSSPAPFGVAGMVASPSGPVLYLGDDGGGALLLVRAPDWKPVTLAREATLARGHIAVDVDRVLLSARRLDPRYKMELLHVATSGDRTTLLTGCGLMDTVHVAMSAKRSVLVAQCNKVLHVFEPKAGTWHEVATLPEPRLLEGIALDAADRLHIERRLRYGEVDAIIALEPTVTPLSTPKDLRVASLTRCGNDLYAAYENTTSAPEVGIARWTGREWQRDRIAATRGPLVIGFDEQCTPFAALADTVWRKSAGTWTNAGFNHRSAWVDAIVAQRGVLYVAFHEIRDGIVSSVATLH